MTQFKEIIYDPANQESGLLEINHSANPELGVFEIHHSLTIWGKWSSFTLLFFVSPQNM